MIAFIAQLTLVFALITAITQCVFPFLGFYQHHTRLLAIAKPAALLQCLFISVSYGLLTLAFLKNDFSILYVAQNSEAYLPWPYRLTALWSGHEGSMLLWILCLNVWTLLYLFLQKISNERQLTLAVLGGISSLLILFLLTSANPFITNAHLLSGNDLNPLLQDPEFFIHPPLLTLGYVGFVLIFSITFSALLNNKITPAYLRTIKIYLILTWCILTLGILLGSFWAYRVLGWGGFWFWDPIENLSLLPWFTGLALIHLLKLAEKNKPAYGLIAGLSLLGFSFSLLGTFLARAGLLVSVHSFATHSLQSFILLLIISFIFFTTLTLFTFKLPPSPPWQRLHQHDLFLLLSVSLSCLVIFILFTGILYPLIRDALHLPSLLINANFYQHALQPLTLLALISIILIPWLLKTTNLAMHLAHFGFIILLSGIILTSVFTQTQTFQLKPGQAAHLGPYQFFFLELTETKTLHAHDIKAHFDVLKSGNPITELTAEKRIYLTRDTIITKPAIHPGLFRDLYLVLGEPLDRDFWSVRITYKPFIRFIILGSAFMMIGGILSLLQRKR